MLYNNGLIYMVPILDGDGLIYGSTLLNGNGLYEMVYNG